MNKQQANCPQEVTEVNKQRCCSASMRKFSYVSAYPKIQEPMFHTRRKGLSAKRRFCVFVLVQGYEDAFKLQID